MDQTLLIYSGIMLLGTFISSVSQVLLKKAAMKEYSSKIREYLNLQVIVAYILFFATTLICIFAYRVVPLSLGPVLEATSYVYVTLFGVFLFRETVSKRKLLALILIVIGVIISSVNA